MSVHDPAVTVRRRPGGSDAVGDAGVYGRKKDDGETGTARPRAAPVADETTQMSPRSATVSAAETMETATSPVGVTPPVRAAGVTALAGRAPVESSAAASTGDSVCVVMDAAAEPSCAVSSARGAGSVASV